MHFIKPFYGCRDGEIYPERFAPGDDCPPELVDAAIACGVVQADEPADASAKKPAGRGKAGTAAQE